MLGIHFYLIKGKENEYFSWKSGEWSLMSNVEWHMDLEGHLDNVQNLHWRVVSWMLASWYTLSCTFCVVFCICVKFMSHFLKKSKAR